MHFMDLDRLLTSLRDMEMRTGKKDKNINKMIDAEIEKITKADYGDLALVSEKNINYFVNKKMQLLKRAYRNGDSVTNAEIATEIEDLAALKLKLHIEVDPTQVNNIFGN